MCSTPNTPQPPYVAVQIHEEEVFDEGVWLQGLLEVGEPGG
jgi:hypothetical protein